MDVVLHLAGNPRSDAVHRDLLDGTDRDLPVPDTLPKGIRRRPFSSNGPDAGHDDTNHPILKG
jgi:hypothetical protein